MSGANQDSSMLLGTKAYRRGIDRIGCHLKGIAARAWTYGWNKEHGKCEGCERCLAGTEEMPKSFYQYLDQWRKRNAEQDMPVVFEEDGSKTRDY